MLPFIARQLLAELGCRGFDVTGLLGAIGLSADELASSGCTLSYAQYARLIRSAIRTWSDPMLPVHVGYNLNAAAWGECLVRMLASADSHAMLVPAAKHSPVFAGLLNADLSAGADGVRLVCGPAQGPIDPPVEEFLALALFAAITRIGRLIVGPNFAATAVSLTRAEGPPEFQHQCGRAFSCDVLLGRPHHVMFFRGRAVPIVTADAAISAWMERRLPPQDAEGYSQDSAIEAAIRSAYARRPVPPPTLSEVAATLHISPRTLRRRLEIKAQRFSDLLDEQRKQAAIRLLRSGNYNVGQVAELVGFSDHRGLSRAVWRWVGCSPRDVRTNASAGLRELSS